jgi:hypothetical protein
MENDTKLFAIRVHNKTHSCVLIKQYENGVWSLPTLEIPEEADPLNYLEQLLEHVKKGPDFELVSAKAIIDYRVEDTDGINQHVVIYDIRHLGQVDSALETGGNKYVASKWTPRTSLPTFKDDFSCCMFALMKSMEMEKCLI